MNDLAADLAADPAAVCCEVVEAQPGQGCNKSDNSRQNVVIQQVRSPADIRCRTDISTLTDHFVHRHIGEGLTQNTVMDGPGT